MTTTALVLVAVLILAIAAGIYAILAPRRPRPEARAQAVPLDAATDWTSEAGNEFGGLSESARCDLVFAVAALDDERAARLLEHALDDSADSVALAAAHVLTTSGRRHIVDAYLAGHSGDRTTRLADALALLD